MKFFVVDLDGVLCDDNHRMEHGLQQNWDAYYEDICHDQPHHDVLSLVHSIGSGRVLLLTARPERYREPTEKWLHEHYIWSHPLMRPDGDTANSEVLKLRLLEEYFGSREAVLDGVLAVLEDRDKIVAAFREYGLNCWQVRPGRY